MRAAILLLSAVTFVAFSSCLRGPEVLDDFESIGLNPTITTLWPLSTPLHPPNQTSMAGRPITNLTLAVNYGINAAAGLDQRPGTADTDRMIGYHVLSILLHIAGGLLLFGVIRRTLRIGRFGERWAARADTIALLVAGIWMLHPLQTAAVSYISQRTEVLVSMFYLATLYASIRAWDAPEGPRRRWWYVAGVVACFLGMGSKEVMVSAPLIILLYDRVFRLNSWRQVFAPAMRSRRWFYVALFATLAFLFVLMASGPRSASVGFHVSVPWYNYLLSQGKEIPRYLRLIFLPTSLTLDYGYRMVQFWHAVPGFMFLVGLGIATIVAWTRVRTWGWLAFCGAWFFCLLAPSSSFVPNGAEVGADRRIYLALAAVLVVLVVLGDAIARWLTRNPAMAALRRKPHAGRTASYALLGILSLLTFRRSGLYTDPVALWRDAIQKVPDNARAYNNLGVVLGALPKPPIAEEAAAFREAIRLDSTITTAWDNLGKIELGLGHTAEAIPIIRHYLQLAPWDQVAAAELARLSAGPGDTALARLPGATADTLSEAAGFVHLGERYLSEGHGLQAQDAFRRAIQTDSTRVDALQYLGGLLMDDGRAGEAVPLLERAVSLDPGNAVNLALLSLAYAKSGKAMNAINAAGRAVAMGQPAAPVFYFAGSAVAEVKRLDLADVYLTKAIELAPTYSDAMSELGTVKEAQGKRAEAADLYRRALAISPLDAKAKAGLARVGGG